MTVLLATAKGKRPLDISVSLWLAKMRERGKRHA